MGQVQLLLLDACVLIDYWEADPSVVSLIVRQRGPVYIAEAVLREANCLEKHEAAAAGLRIEEPEFDLLVKAAIPPPGLSFEDMVCLLLAKEKGWTCVSNDR